MSASASPRPPASARARQHAKREAIPRPPAALILGTPVHFIAFGFGAGLARHAPGTWGTLVAVPLAWALLWLPWPAYLVATLLAFGLGCWACGESGRLLGVEDYPGFVFDEVVGYLIAVAPVLAWLGPLDPWLAPALLFAFVAFRAFDILKPWPIGWLDRRIHGGFGVMLDDAGAGVYSAATVAAACWSVLGVP